MPGGVAAGAGVRGVAGCGAGVRGVAGCGAGVRGVASRGAVGIACTGVGEGVGTEVGVLAEEELPTPPAASKWTYSTMKSSYVGVELSSTALPHAHPRPSLNTTSRAVRTRCVFGS